MIPDIEFDRRSALQPNRPPSLGLDSKLSAHFRFYVRETHPKLKSPVEISIYVTMYSRMHSLHIEDQVDTLLTSDKLIRWHWLIRNCDCDVVTWFPSPHTDIFLKILS